MLEKFEFTQGRKSVISDVITTKDGVQKSVLYFYMYNRLIAYAEPYDMHKKGEDILYDFSDKSVLDKLFIYDAIFDYLEKGTKALQETFNVVENGRYKWFFEYYLKNGMTFRNEKIEFTVKGNKYKGTLCHYIPLSKLMNMSFEDVFVSLKGIICIEGTPVDNCFKILIEKSNQFTFFTGEYLITRSFLKTGKIYTALKEDILLAAKYKLLDDKLPVLTAITEDGVAVFDWDYNCEK